MRRLTIFFIIVTAYSCQPSVPENVLAPQKMQAVMWDMMQADELAAYYSISDSSFRGLKMHADYYQKIFSIHNISKQQFVESLRYYENNPVKLKRVLDSLQKFGERLQRSDTLKRTDTPSAPDSSKKQMVPPVQQH